MTSTSLAVSPHIISVVLRGRNSADEGFQLPSAIQSLPSVCQQNLKVLSGHIEVDPFGFYPRNHLRGPPPGSLTGGHDQAGGPPPISQAQYGQNKVSAGCEAEGACCRHKGAPECGSIPRSAQILAANDDVGTRWPPSYLG
ncbi:unnamed protein product [Pleuronectes platessa]|uniref:Uncharacterized protein n=1 Tax=Pleuronectes platessa TaxID=8262 RepID=A0A9N7Y5C3_PLEPL|nr:unnamed protein product [Pleuronectes platessa]